MSLIRSRGNKAPSFGSSPGFARTFVSSPRREWVSADSITTCFLRSATWRRWGRGTKRLGASERGRPLGFVVDGTCDGAARWASEPPSETNWVTFEFAPVRSRTGSNGLSRSARMSPRTPPRPPQWPMPEPAPWRPAHRHHRTRWRRNPVSPRYPPPLTPRRSGFRHRLLPSLPRTRPLPNPSVFNVRNSVPRAL